MLSYIFDDPPHGFEICAKVGKLDLCEDVGLDGGSYELLFRAKVYGTTSFAMCFWLQEMCQDVELDQICWRLGASSN
jgi:hypothetical protein